MTIKQQVVRLKKIQKAVGKKRDELRELQTELEDFLETIEQGCFELDDGVRHLESGIDSLSQQV